MTDLNILGLNPSGFPATSGTYNFSVTRDDIIRQSMLNLGLLEQSEVPTAIEVTDCARVLNMIVKQLVGGNDKAPGFKMWQRHRGALFLAYSKYAYALGENGDPWAASVTGLSYPNLYQQNQLTAAVAQGGTVLPVASTAAINIGDRIGIQVGSDIQWTTISGYVANTSITIPAPGLSVAAAANNYVWNFTRQAQNPVMIKTALLRDIYGSDTPLTRMTLEEYEALPTKTQPGFVQDPTAFYYERQIVNNSGRFYIDCAGAQDVTKHIHVVYLRESQDFNNPGDGAEFPQEWYLHLSWSLSLHICGMFDADWTPDRQAAYSVAVSAAREANPQDTSDYFQVEDIP